MCSVDNGIASFVLTCGLVASAVTSLVAQPDHTSTIRETRIAQNAAIAARDLERISSFWTDDVTITAGLGAVLRGRDAYREAFANADNIIYQRTSTRIDVSTNWNLAWEEGRWLGYAEGGSETALAIRGRYAAQWVRRDGQWLIRSELFVALDCTGPACLWPVAPR